MTVNTHPSFIIRPKASPDTGVTVGPGRGNCGRKAVATRPEDRRSVGRKGNQKAERGQANPGDRMPDKPLLIRAGSVSDSREITRSTR